MPLLDHMAWFGSKFNLFLVYFVPFDWKFNSSHSSHSPLETTFSLKPTGMWSVSPARWVIKVTSSISWKTSRFSFTVDTLVKKQSHSMRATRHAYCLPVLWNGAVSVQDVVNPTSDPWLAILWVNQGGIFCWNRMGDIQLSLILPLQSSAFSKKNVQSIPQQQWWKTGLCLETWVTFEDFLGYLHHLHTMWAGPAGFLKGNKMSSQWHHFYLYALLSGAK